MISVHHINSVSDTPFSLGRKRFEKIFNLYLEGYSYRDIGRELGISAQRVGQVIYKYATPDEVTVLKKAIERRCVSGWAYEKIEPLLAQGKKHKEIAEILSISVHVVKRASAKRRRHLAEISKAA